MENRPGRTPPYLPTAPLHCHHTRSPTPVRVYCPPRRDQLLASLPSSWRPPVHSTDRPWQASPPQDSYRRQHSYGLAIFPYQALNSLEMGTPSLTPQHLTGCLAHVRVPGDVGRRLLSFPSSKHSSRH